MIEQQVNSVSNDDDDEESFLVKICECYFNELNELALNVSKDENVAKGDDEHEAKSNDECEAKDDVENEIENNDDTNSLINETGSLKDETQGNCQWTESLIDKEESIYNMTLPKSFYELDTDTESPGPKKTILGKSFIRQHRRNLSLHDFSSILDKKEVSTLKVDAWLNASKNKNECKSSGEKKNDADIEILFNNHIEEENKAKNYQRKIHPKYANKINDVSEALNIDAVILGSSGVKRKRKRIPNSDTDDSFSKKFKHSHKGWISYFSGWVADLFN